MKTPSNSAGAHEAEIERIRGEYARRERNLPPDYYGWNRPVNLFYHCQLVRRCIAALAKERQFPLAGKRIADIGCGSGSWLIEFVQWGADLRHLSGIDLDAKRLETARGRLARADLRVGDAQMLPWPDDSFDLVSQFTLFTSVLEPAARLAMAREMVRVLKPGGLILWYDFRFDNPRNPNVRGVGEAELRGLFPGCHVRLQSLTLAPPIARFLAPASWVLAFALEWLPFLRTHYLGVIRKPSR